MSPSVPKPEAHPTAHLPAEQLDPRIRRTQRLLQQSLENLLKTKDFDRISVQDITEAATLNRATFYDHYADKFALLECMVANQFNDLLTRRGVVFDGACVTAIRAIVLGVCDYLASTPRLGTCERQRQMEPHLEAAVITVVKNMLLYGLRLHPVPGLVSQEMAAAAASWAIYGAAKQWLQTPNRCPAEHTADLILTLVARILTPVESTLLAHPAESAPHPA